MSSAAKIVIPALVVLVIALLLTWLLLSVLYSYHGTAELGTDRDDGFGENVTVTADHPLGVRILSATVDPVGEPLDSIPLYLQLSTNLPPSDMWISAIRIEDQRPTYLEPTSVGSYHDEFPPTCLRTTCSRTYALVACWRRPVAGIDTPVYFGGNLTARRLAGTPPARVVLERVGNRLDGDVATDVAKASGCAVTP